jgi:hypothetical protein
MVAPKRADAFAACIDAPNSLDDFRSGLKRAGPLPKINQDK